MIQPRHDHQSFHRQTGGYASRVSAEARKNVAPNGGYATFAKAASGHRDQVDH